MKTVIRGDYFPGADQRQEVLLYRRRAGKSDAVCVEDFRGHITWDDSAASDCREPAVMTVRQCMFQLRKLAVFAPSSFYAVVLEPAA